MNTDVKRKLENHVETYLNARRLVAEIHAKMGEAR